MARPHALLRAGFPYLKTLGTYNTIEAPIDVAVTRDLKVFVLRRARGWTMISRLSWEDDHIGNMRSMGLQDGRSPWPSALVLDADENLVTSDESQHRITFATQDGEVIDQWGEHGDLPGQLDRPSGIGLDPEGNVYVVDALNSRVQRFTRDGRFMTAWGSRGDGPGEFDMPWGIHVDELGDVYVVDWRNDRVQKFTGEGEFLFEFGGSGSADGELTRPAGIAVDPHGDIYVADEGNNRVQLFDAEGHYVEKFLGDDVMSQSGRVTLLSTPIELRLRASVNLEAERRFWGPRSVRVDAEGRMFVVEYHCARVQIYQKDANPLNESQIGAPVRAPSLSYE